MSGNLPNAPVNDVVIIGERETVYVGTDVGVFYPQERQEELEGSRGAGSPSRPCSTSGSTCPSDTLYAGTFGRSVWKVGL